MFRRIGLILVTALATALRRDGNSVELVLGEPKLKRALSDADRAGARQVYVVGPDELARGEVLVRDLASGEQRTEPLPDQVTRSDGVGGA